MMSKMLPARLATSAAAASSRGACATRRGFVRFPATSSSTTRIVHARALSSSSPFASYTPTTDTTHGSEPMATPLTPEQIRHIGERSKSLQEEHLRLKTDVPASSLDPSSPTVDKDLIRRKRLLYRSKQRGWLEVDLLLGSWAAEHVMTLSEAQLDEYELLLNQETIDIFNIVNGAMAPPPELEGSQILKQVQDYANGSPFGKASAQTYEEVKDRTNLI